MKQQATIQAAPRAGTGKGAARTLRREGRVPAVIYGRGREPEAVAVETVALNRLLATIPARTTIVDVAVEGRPALKALIREIQRAPNRPAEILHLDLYEVHADEKISVEVPLRFVGVAEGVRNFGGVLDQIMHSLELHVLPGDIPTHVEVDVTALNIGQSIHVEELRVEKAEILNDPRSTVCTVVAPRAEEVAAPVPEGEAAAPAEPELIRKPKAEEGEAEGAAEE